MRPTPEEGHLVVVSCLTTGPKEDIVEGPIVVGFGGSSESPAAIDSAGHEAVRPRLPPGPVQAWPWAQPSVRGGEEAGRCRQRLIDQEVAQGGGARDRGVGLHVPDDGAAVPETAAKNASILVPGSRVPARSGGS